MAIKVLEKLMDQELITSRISIMDLSDPLTINAVLMEVGYDYAGFYVHFRNRACEKEAVYDVENNAPGHQFLMTIKMDETLVSPVDQSPFSVNKMEILKEDTKEKLVLYDFEQLLEPYAYILMMRKQRIENIPVRLGAHVP